MQQQLLLVTSRGARGVVAGTLLENHQATWRGFVTVKPLCVSISLLDVVLDGDNHEVALARFAFATMDRSLAPSPRNMNEIEAFPVEKSTRVIRFIVAALAVAGLLGVLVLWGIPYALPFLKPLGVHVLYRLREVSIFLLFTTVIAIGILKTPQNAADGLKASPDQYPLSSIFGEAGSLDMLRSEVAEQRQKARTDYYSGVKAKAENAVDLGRISGASKDDSEGDASSSRQRKAPSLASEADNFSSREARKVVASGGNTIRTHRRNLSASREEGYRPVNEGDPRLPAPVIPQRTLHRRSSSLDDSVNYEPASETEDTPPQPNADGSLPSCISPPRIPSNRTPNEAKPDTGHTGSGVMHKRVSFSMDHNASIERKSQEGDKRMPLSSSESSRTERPSNMVLSSSDNDENTRGRGEQLSSLSSNELNKQADAFIAKFKEQIRLQKLESFQRYRRRLA